MAPKGMQQEKKGSKVKEDKTFGLKNKNKSSKVQKEVAKVKQQVADAGNPKLKKAEEERRKAVEAKKKDAQLRKELDADLFNVVLPAQKVPFGVDPKTVLCQFFKIGKCEKGARCKFSHDLDVGRKVVKKDLYTDARDQEKVDDTMDKWDEEKLRSVVLSKYGNPKTTTDIVCKFFLEAVETQKYGWFWICPNGGDNCQYRHSLPPGFVLKSKEKKKEDKAVISLEEFLETERHKITGTRTPVTLESFTKWKSERVAKQQAVVNEEAKQKEQRRMAGKLTGLSGKEVFAYKPLDEYDDEDDEEFDITEFRQRGSDEESADEDDSESEDEADSVVGSATGSTA